MKSNLRGTTELLGSVQQSQFVLLCGAFQCKPHQWLNIAKFIHGVGASLSFFLTVEGKRQTTVPWLDPPLENLYWPSLWCKVSSFCDVLHLSLTSLLLFEFLFLLIFSFYFPFLYFITIPGILAGYLSWKSVMMHPFICDMDSPVIWMAGSDGLTGRVYQASELCRDSVLSPSTLHTLHSRVFTWREFFALCGSDPQWLKHVSFISHIPLMNKLIWIDTGSSTCYIMCLWNWDLDRQSCPWLADWQGCSSSQKSGKVGRKN